MESKGKFGYDVLLRWLGQTLEVPPHLWGQLALAWIGSAIALNVMRMMGIGSKDLERQAWPKIMDELKRLMEDYQLVEDLGIWEIDFLETERDQG